jgi:hypothetical protein
VSELDFRPLVKTVFAEREAVKQAIDLHLDSMTTEELEKYAYKVVSKFGLRTDAKMRSIKKLVDMFDYHERAIQQALDELERENREQS